MHGLYTGVYGLTTGFLGVWLKVNGVNAGVFEIRKTTVAASQIESVEALVAHSMCRALPEAL